MELRDKKVLVTGADGFIGSHLTELLAAQGARVRALSCYNSFNHWGWLEDLPCLREIEVVTGDIRDAGLMESLCEGQDMVFHLAALIAIPYSYRAPESYQDVNVRGTLNICRGALRHGCRMLHVSTSEVYGTARYAPIDELHPLQPQSPYSASKIGADALAMSFYHSFGLPLVIARPFNTYGPRQSARAVIPTLIGQLLSGRKGIEMGSLTPTRDFNYVTDTARGMMELMRAPAALGQTVNIGSGREIAIGELAELIIRLAGAEAHIVRVSERLRPENSEVERLVCDNAKLRSLTGFVPCFSLEEGLTETIRWFSHNLEKYKTNIYNI